MMNQRKNNTQITLYFLRAGTFRDTEWLPVRKFGTTHGTSGCKLKKPPASPRLAASEIAFP
jgi:hypothetical protein